MLDKKNITNRIKFLSIDEISIKIICLMSNKISNK